MKKLVDRRCFRVMNSSVRFLCLEHGRFLFFLRQEEEEEAEERRKSSNVFTFDLHDWIEKMRVALTNNSIRKSIEERGQEENHVDSVVRSGRRVPIFQNSVLINAA